LFFLCFDLVKHNYQRNDFTVEKDFTVDLVSMAYEGIGKKIISENIRSLIGDG